MMTPRERILCCLDHRKPDRVPLNGEFRPEVWKTLEAHFETTDRDAISDALGLDFKPAKMGLPDAFRERAVDTPIGTLIPCDDGSFENEMGVRMTIGEGIPYRRYVSHPVADESGLDGYRLPDLHAPGMFREARESVPRLQERYVVAAPMFTFFRSGWELRGFEQWLIDLALDAPIVPRVLDLLLEQKLEEVRLLADVGVDIMSLGGDIAMHRTLFMQPDTWRKHFKWRDALVVEEGRKHGIERFYFHTDGNLMEVMEDLIEIGFTIFDPIQPECMDPYEVKERFGDRITLHGTISSQHRLPFGTPEDVRREVRERIERCGQDGGLVIAPNNVVQFDVPLENLLALYDAAKEA